MPPQFFNVIIAVDEDYGISREGKIPWVNPRDMANFKKITTSVPADGSPAPNQQRNTLIMGRRTYDEVRGKPLANRDIFVVSRTVTELPHARVFASFDAALAACSNGQIFVCGGRELYVEALKHPAIAAVYLSAMAGHYGSDNLVPEIKVVFDQDDGWTYVGKVHDHYHLVKCNYAEHQYISLMRDIVTSGNLRPNRTSTRTYSTFGPQLRYQLIDSFGRKVMPLMTTKKVSYKLVLSELLWMLRGDTNVKYLHEHGNKIWDGNSSREFLDARGLTKYSEGELGPCFPAGTQILTSHGHVAVEEVHNRDLLMTSLGNWKPITEMFSREYNGELVTLELSTAHGSNIICTREHPIATSFRTNTGLSPPQWIAAGDILEGMLVGMNINPRDDIPEITYMYDGIQFSHRLTDVDDWIAMGYFVRNELMDQYTMPDPEERSCFPTDGHRWAAYDQALLARTIPYWVHAAPRMFIRAFLYGYEADDHPRTQTPEINASIQLLKMRASLIAAEYAHGYLWFRVEHSHRRAVENVRVYNFTVADDNTYIANNIAVHNCYGFQWRHFGAEYIAEFARAKPADPPHRESNSGIDQIAEVIANIKEDPYSRRHVVSAWNPRDLSIMALPPCHYTFMYNVEPKSQCDPTPYYLSCHLVMRSNDMFLGHPFNAASYATLCHMIAALCGLHARELIITMNDAHVYENHVTQVHTQALRPLYGFPTIEWSDEISKKIANQTLTIDDFDMSSVILNQYISGDIIRASMVT